MHAILLPLYLLTLTPVTLDSSMTDPRDGQVYPIVQIGGLWWMQENLKYETAASIAVNLSDQSIPNCGEFYGLDDALNSCPSGWRLPTEKEVRRLLKADRRFGGLIKQLQIGLCGRIDNGVHRKPEEQNTFWIDAEVQDGHILHWHTFGEDHELHSHNVVQAERQFPVRCVCEVDEE